MMDLTDQGAAPTFDFEFTKLASDGLRLIKAFRDITDPTARALAIDFVEQLAYKQRSKTS